MKYYISFARFITWCLAYYVMSTYIRTVPKSNGETHGKGIWHYTIMKLGHTNDLF